jgi:Asp-tRNA(Asn)/Glu-tRNA(Gln) amidotransferase A subunit family amidase
MKPTYSLIPTEGVYPLAWSLDHVGFFTRSVGDASTVLDALTGARQPSAVEPLDEPPKIGLLKGFFHDHAEDDVREGFEQALERLKDAGAQMTEIAVPKSFDAIHAAHRVIMSSEAASVHKRNFIERMSDYRPNLGGLVASGLLIPAHIYLKAGRIRGRFIEDMTKASSGLDCLVTPSAPTPALHGLESTGDASFNSPWSMTGFPTITVPSSLTKEGLPLGVQLAGLPHEEESLLSTAAWCEGAVEANMWPTLYP